MLEFKIGFLNFSNICCWYTLELPYRGNSNVHRQHMSIHRAVAAYLKVVRRRKPSSAEGTMGGGGESTREGLIPLSLGGFGGPPPRNFLIFERFSVCF